MTILVSAWPSWRRSQTSIGGGSGASSVKLIVGMRDFVQEQRLARDLDDILVAEDGLGHPREGGEFVDHPPKVADLADDGAGQLVEGGRIALDLLAVAALEPFGGELDRGQRILDLVRDAARDVGPGGAALVEQLLGNIVEGEDEAPFDLHLLDGKRSRLAAGGKMDDPLALFAVEMVRELGRQRRQFLSDRRFRGQS